MYKESHVIDKSVKKNDIGIENTEGKENINNNIINNNHDQDGVDTSSEWYTLLFNLLHRIIIKFLAYLLESHLCRVTIDDLAGAAGASNNDEFLDSLLSSISASIWKKQFATVIKRKRKRIMFNL